MKKMSYTYFYFEYIVECVQCSRLIVVKQTCSLVNAGETIQLYQLYRFNLSINQHEAKKHNQTDEKQQHIRVFQECQQSVSI